MTNSEKKALIYNFLDSHSLTALSYINDRGTPSSAVVQYVVTNDLEILFNTFTSKRKYSSIISNQNVACVVGWDWDENITVQFEGEAKQQEAEDLQKFRAEYYKKLPEAEKFKKDYEHLGELAMFKISPKFINYSDFNKKEWDIETLKF